MVVDLRFNSGVYGFSLVGDCYGNRIRSPHPFRSNQPSSRLSLVFYIFSNLGVAN